MVTKTTFVKAIETPKGILIKTRKNNDEFNIEHIDFQNYFFVSIEDFLENKKLISNFSNNVTRYTAINGEFAKIYLNDNTKRNFLKYKLEVKGYKTYEADINVNKRYLIDKFENHEFGDVKILWYDIETDDRGDFLKDENNVVISNGKQILSIALEDEDGNKFYFYNKNPDNIEASEELEMLKKAFDVMKDYDLITAWNGNSFDRPYIEQRLSFHKNEFLINEFRLLIHLDEMIKYKTLTFTKHDSYSLEKVANDLLSDGKIDFSDDVQKGNGRFYELFKTNPEKFKEYNLKDVELMKKIDEKTRQFYMAKNISKITKTPIESFMFNSHILDLVLTRKNKSQNRIVDSKPTKFELEDRYKDVVGGGYTFCYTNGLYKNVKVRDYKSHYPLTMMTFNISKETYVSLKWPVLEEVKEHFTSDEYKLLTYIKKQSIDFVNRKITAKQKSVNINRKFKELFDNIDIDEKLNKLMFTFVDKYNGIEANKHAKQQNLIVTPADINKDVPGWSFHPHRYFSKTQGILSGYVKYCVETRDKLKLEKKRKAETNLNYEGSDEQKSDWYHEVVVKLLANSAFGYSGLRISRYYDWNIADTITTAARWITKKSILFCNKLNVTVTSGDTDSIFVEDSNWNGTDYDLDVEFYKYYTNEMFNIFNLPEDRFEFIDLETKQIRKHHYYCIFEHEKTFDSLIIIAKKRYYFLMNDKVDTMGGTFKKTDTNPLAAKLQKELCEDLLRFKYNNSFWKNKLLKIKNDCFNFKLDAEYLTYKNIYTKHHSAYGQAMLDSSGNHKTTANGKLRYAPVPAQIRLAKRLEEEGKEIQLGDMIIYIIGEPLAIGLKPSSRKKAERELFFKLYIENDSIEENIQRMKQNNCEYTIVYDSKQRAITVDEYKRGVKYDTHTYWSNIISPVKEILNVTDKELYDKL